MLGMSVQADLAASTIRTLSPTVEEGSWSQIVKCLEVLPKIREQFGSFRSDGAENFEHQIFRRLEVGVQGLTPEGFEPQQDLYNALCLAVVSLSEKGGDSGGRSLSGLKAVQSWMKIAMESERCTRACAAIAAAAASFTAAGTHTAARLREAIEAHTQQATVGADEQQSEIIIEAHRQMTKGLAINFKESNGNEDATQLIELAKTFHRRNSFSSTPPENRSSPSGETQREATP